MLRVANEQEMLAFGQRLAKSLVPGVIVHLKGPLGAGKTTLTRAILQGLGHTGNVKSPTYTLVEPYEIDHKIVYHFDLYRLEDPLELEAMGIRDYFSHESICIIEWPERAGGMLPEPDVLIEIEFAGEGREVEVTANTSKGKKLLNAMTNDIK